MSTCPHCGKGGKRRSVDQHRRYFAMCKLAFDNWPEAHEFQPDNAEHLRKWLLKEAGHRTVTEVRVSRTDPQSMKIARAAAEAAMDAVGDYCWVVPHNKKIYVVAAKSIAFEKCPHAEFLAVNEAVQTVLERELGVRIDDLMLEAA